MKKAAKRIPAADGNTISTWAKQFFITSYLSIINENMSVPIIMAIFSNTS